jgi:hypothetical protein
MAIAFQNPFQNARTRRLTRTMAAARTTKASADEGVASWSRASLRQRLSQPKVRSTAQRRGWTAKPFWPSGAHDRDRDRRRPAHALARVGAVGEAARQERPGAA